MRKAMLVLVVGAAVGGAAGFLAGRRSAPGFTLQLSALPGFSGLAEAEQTPKIDDWLYPEHDTVSSGSGSTLKITPSAGWVVDAQSGYYHAFRARASYEEVLAFYLARSGAKDAAELAKQAWKGGSNVSGGLTEGAWRIDLRLAVPRPARKGQPDYAPHTRMGVACGGPWLFTRLRRAVGCGRTWATSGTRGGDGGWSQRGWGQQPAL